MQLAVPDIDGEHLFRAMREQHLREAAGRRADIETRLSADGERIDFQGLVELDAAARNERVRLFGFDHGIGHHHVRGARDGLAIDANKAGRNGSLRLRAAFEQAALEQNLIGALAG